MNAAIQCLVHTPSLADFFLSQQYKVYLSTSDKVGSFFADVVQKIYTPTNDAYSYYAGRSESVSPDDFHEGFCDDEVAPQFAGWRQHDSHEFLRVLIDLLCDDLKDSARCQENKAIRQATEEDLEHMNLQSKADYWWKCHLTQNASFITDEFCGQLVSTIQCSVCGTNRYCFDPFYDISLPFPTEERSSHKNQHRRTPRMLPMLRKNQLQRCTLDDCLREFGRDEALDGDNCIDCSTCREKQPSSKRLQVFRFPKVLVLHLKRFGNSRKKVETSVDFPLTGLDASPLAHASGGSAYYGVKPIYDLHGIINHSGQLNYGHYVAQCVDPSSDSWYEFNDTRVSGIVEKDMSEEDAYCLFYRLRE